MKNLLCIAVIGGAFASLAAQPTGQEWQDNQQLSHGREPVRAAFCSFDSAAEALKILPEYAPRQISLDSDKAWKFNWAKDPSVRPVDFYRVDFDDSAWATIKVPCSWQAYGANGQGGWGTPLYTNIRYPFARDVPGGSKVMGEPPKDFTNYAARNPVGSYRRTFKVPANWDGRDIFLKFDGVDSFFYLWVNGEYVGFSKDSRTPAEFDVTAFVKPGAPNLVALEVYRYSDGSYLEDQDMFRLSGIFRRTWLLARPKTRIRDFFVTARPVVADRYEGVWEMTIDTEGDVETCVYDWEDRLVAGPFAAKRFPVPNVKPWSAEAPNCYKVVLNNGAEWVSAVFGFRVSEIRDGRYYLNGQKIKLKGANRHETDPMFGHFVPKARHEQDIRQLKEANCNAVRNAHYPQDDYWYYLCNVHGIYLCDEANVESHGYGYGADSLSHQKSWEKAIVARDMAMVERNKNHPSVVIWSYGNESGPGENFRACERAIKARDTTRPTHYERDWSVADMEGCQYPAVAWCWSKAADSSAKKPFYISEYAHNMVNAMGNLKDYQDAIESSDVILGATIWDWVDQGLWKRQEDGTMILAFGGDFGDKPNDGQFVMNGCVLSDRTPEPGYEEIRHVYQNWTVKETNYFQRVVVRNKNYFVDATGVELLWTVLIDGEPAASGEFNLHGLKPQREAVYEMPSAATAACRAEGTASIRFRFRQNGRIIASDQIDLADARPAETVAAPAKIWYALSDAAEIGYAEDEKSFTFTAKNTKIAFCKKTGMPYSIVRTGWVFDTELLKSPLKLDAFRTPSSNEIGPAGKWLQNGLRNLTGELVEMSSIDQYAGALTFTTRVTWRGAAFEDMKGFGGPQITITEARKPLNPVTFAVASRWTIYGDGTVACISKIRPLGPRFDLARLGYACELAAVNPRVEWFGRGPWENYPDRKSGAFLGRWSADASTFFFPYARNENCGNREDTRGVRVGELTVRTLGAPFAFEVNPYTPSQLLEIVHPPELPESTSTYFGIYAATRGLGGASCGPGPMERDIIRTDRDYDLSFTLSFGDRALTARVPEGPAYLPELPERVLVGGAKIATCSSREPGEGDPEHLLDGDLGTIWHSQYGTTMGNFPHAVAVELAKETEMKGLTCYGRPNGVNGRVKDCMVETSSDGKIWTERARATLRNTADGQDILFPAPVKARFYRFTAFNNHYGDDFASMAEIVVIK
ncbi:MAG: glycoside hydrolase family 2 TIM barrel-domain containing protein [Kiritimatiellia bacterium]